MIILYQKYREVSWLRGIDSYLFLMILSFSTNIFAYYLLKTIFLDEKIMKTGPKVYWWVCSFIRMNDNLVPKIKSSLLVEKNHFIPFLMILIFAINIFAYYLLKTTYLEEITKTGPRVHWWVCSFIMMNDNIVLKIQSSLLVNRNWFIHFSNDFELRNQYFHILPPQNNMHRENHENRPQSTLMSL